MSDVQHAVQLNISLSVFSALVTLLLWVGCIADRSRDWPFMKHFIRLLAAHLVTLLGETGLCLLEGAPEHTVLIRLCGLFSCCGGYLAVMFHIFCLLAFIRERTELSAGIACGMIGICAVFALLTASAVLTGRLFQVDGGVLVCTGGYILLDGGRLLLLLLEMGLVLRRHRVLALRETVSLLSFSVLPAAALPLRCAWGAPPVYMAATLSLIVIYTMLHGELSRQLLEKEAQLNESRISILLSQIQPHFLYNTLVSIQSLCRRDPERAWEALGAFSTYLRGNMDTLTNRGMIHFSKELQHIETYLKLEKLRFGQRLEVVYDVETEDFLLPPLTVQPLVENAVKHGICARQSGGTVTLRTRRIGRQIIIMVEDTGAGFDPNQAREDGRTHVGLQNVRSRLRLLAAGELTIASAPGLGTRAVITLNGGGPAV